MTFVVVVFVIVYLGMVMGGFPGLKVDRSAIALIGAIALLASGEINRAEAGASIDFGTIGLLFGLMIVSVNLDLAGLYSVLSGRLHGLSIRPSGLLAIVTVMSGVLSAFLTNDVIAVAFAPVLLGICIDHKVNPVPFLLALACGANAGSIATIIGSPQNMLIGEHFDLSFTRYMAYTAVPALVSLVIVWAVIALRYRGEWQYATTVKIKKLKHRHFNPIEATKGLILTVGLVGLFIFTSLPRDLIALSAGAILLANAHFSSHKILHKVDWQLLILFIGLFIVNGAMQKTGLPQDFIADMAKAGISLADPVVLFLTTAVLSDVVSNVPSVMLLLPHVEHPSAGPIMAIASGLSSNLIIIGSMASIIVVDQAAKRGLRISFWSFASIGIPITIATLAFAGFWLWLLS